MQQQNSSCRCRMNACANLNHFFLHGVSSSCDDLLICYSACRNVVTTNDQQGSLLMYLLIGRLESSHAIHVNLIDSRNNRQMYNLRLILCSQYGGQTLPLSIDQTNKQANVEIKALMIKYMFRLFLKS